MAAAACGGGGEEIVREREGVRLTLTTNGDEFEVGETIELQVVAKNLRDAPLSYGFVDAEEPPLQLRVNSELGGDQLVNSADAPQGAETGTLEPGEELRISTDWDQTLAIYEVPLQAPEGEYTVTARLLVNDSANGGEPIEVVAAASVSLIGGETLYPPSDAILTAIRQPELRNWIEARNAVSVVCLYQTTGKYYSALLASDQAATDQVNEIFAQLYSVQLENGKPVCSPVSVGAEWRVQFLSTSGPEPRRVAVYMDIHTGENARYEEGGLEPQASPVQ